MRGEEKIDCGFLFLSFPFVLHGHCRISVFLFLCCSLLGRGGSPPPSLPYPSSFSGEETLDTTIFLFPSFLGLWKPFFSFLFLPILLFLSYLRRIALPPLLSIALIGTLISYYGFLFYSFFFSISFLFPSGWSGGGGVRLGGWGGWNGMGGIGE